MVVGNDIKELLNSKVHQYNNLDFIETDPIFIPHQFDQKEDIEIAGFLTAVIAWGNRKMIIRNAFRLMELMDYSPFEFVRGATKKEIRLLNGFVHRTFNGIDLAFFIYALQNIYSKYSCMGSLVEMLYCKHKDIGLVIDAWRNMFFETPHEKRSEKHFASPEKGSTAKRLNMFIRWMVRKDNKGVDFGLWNIPQAALYIPLDVHVGNVARGLGLLDRKQNDWKAVKKLTSLLKELCPEDPVKYDYALFGLGVFENYGK